MDFQSVWGWSWTLYCLATGIVLGWIWGTAPLKEKVKVLQSLLAQERVKNLDLVQDLKWKKAKVMALESDLEKCREKMMWSSDQRGW
jgi:hypothetical protein